MTTSICMGIYNGEKYIEAQLASILRQTQEPEEVIMCDDGSTDQTVSIVQRFIEENKLQGKWQLFCNEHNKGYPMNFYYAMSLCSKDIVFLADQDDIWEENKLERMCTTFNKHLDAKAVCCKFGLIDENGEKIRTFMSPTHSKNTGKVRFVNIQQVFYKCEWPGMVLAYRRQWYEHWKEYLAKKEPEQYIERIPHDFLICARAAEDKGFFQLDENLAWHRRHDKNTGSEEYRIGKLLNKQHKLREIENYLEILDAFDRGDMLLTKEGRNELLLKKSSMLGRWAALKSGKISQVIKNFVTQKGRMRLVTLLCDMLIVRSK